MPIVRAVWFAIVRMAIPAVAGNRVILIIPRMIVDRITMLPIGWPSSLLTKNKSLNSDMP